MHHPAFRFAALAGLFVAALGLPAQAQDIGVIYAGGNVGQGYNVNGGAVVSLPGDSLGDGIAVRVGGAAGEYRYDAGVTEIQGTYVTGELAIVYQTSDQWGWANFSGGPRVTDTKLEPADPSNALSGTRWDIALATDGAVGNTWRLGWFGSLGVLDHTYIGELRLARMLDKDSQTRIGVETGLQGDDSYQRASLGVFASALLAEKMEGRFSVGFSEQRGRDASPYAAISVSRTF